MASVGNVRIGSRNIDIRAFTGTSSRSHRNTVLLSNPKGRHPIAVSERAISIARGQTITGFWGVVRGRDSDWLALFNHDTGAWAWFAPARNKLAGPPMHQLLIVVAAGAGIVGAMTGRGSVDSHGAATCIAFVTAALIVWRVHARRKALTSAVTAALRTVRMEA
jgi:hypothetical protein